MRHILSLRTLFDPDLATPDRRHKSTLEDLLTVELEPTRPGLRDDVEKVLKPTSTR